MAYQRPEYDDMAPRLDRADRDAPINVHEGCTLLPFTLVQFGEFGKFRLRYTIGALLEIEQVFNRSLWTIIEQALIGTLGEEEKIVILNKGLQGMKMDVMTVLNSLERKDALRIFKQSQLELTRAIGHEVMYDENGIAVSMQPKRIDSYKKAQVRDTENFALKKPELATFSQYYELAINTLFQIGVTMPMDELLSLMPIELEAMFEAHDKRLIYLQQMALFEAWHAGAFTGLSLSGEKLPELEPMLRRIARQSDKETKSKFTREKAQAIIDQDKQDAEEAERMLSKKRQQGQQAKQSEDGEKK